MTVNPRFSSGLALRIGGLVATTAAATLVAVDGRFVVAPLVLMLAVGIQAWGLGHFVRRTNREVARFLATAGAGDFSERFEREREDVGFDALGRALSQVLERIRGQREQAEIDLRVLRAIVDQVPVPLITVASDGRLARVNQAARRFFGPVHVAKLEDVRPFGDDLVGVLTTLEPGQTQLVDVAAGDRILVRASQVRTATTERRVFSLQSLRGELERAESDAWHALVRVLTHELMNSLTPIRSLASTAADLLAEHEPSADGEAIEDATTALRTVAKRADGLLAFIESYREIARLPKPDKRRVALQDLFRRVVHLFSEEEGSPRFETSVNPKRLALNGDPGQIEQILINLVRNAVDAAPGVVVELRGQLDARGRPTIVVADDGPGIPPDVASKMFVPFFTTKRDGSGVGLSLTRQIMRAHDGHVSYAPNFPSGARFTLHF